MHTHLSPRGVRSIWKSCLTAGAIVPALVALIHPCAGQVTDVGGIARNFTVTERRTGQPIRLYDFAGSVVVLDFFAYWCGPCQASSPDLKANIDDYYTSRGGNPHGVPVVVLSVNIESQNPSATDAFINAFGLHLVADDFSGVAYDQFGNGFIPMFVIINGAANVPSYDQWEVLYRDSGYPGSAHLRSIIDPIDPSDPTGPAAIRIAPVSQAGRVGEFLAFNVTAEGAAPITYQWFKNDVPISGATTNKLALAALTLKNRGSYKVKVSNGLGSQMSAPAGLMVYERGSNSLFVSTNVPKAIPDYPAPGVTLAFNVQNDWEVMRLGTVVNIAHTYTGDLAVSLTSPSGTTVTLREATGAAGTQLSINLSDLRTFVGQRARGTWTLKVVDLYAQDVGTVTSWSLTVEHPPEAMSYQEWAAGYPAVNLTDLAADSDGDTIPNYLEFLMDGFSPQAANRLPTLEVDPGDNQYFQLVVPLRPGTERALLSVQLASSLGNNAWTEAVTSGDNVIVDQSVPNTLKVKLKRSLGTMFLRMLGVPL